LPRGGHPVAPGGGPGRGRVTTWDDVRLRLHRDLATLDDREFVVVGEPSALPGPRRGLLRRRDRPAPTRYVQALRDGNHLLTECVGATLFGGDWEVDATTHERLGELGWLVPGDPDPSAWQPSYPNYWRVVERAEAARLAAM